MTKILPMRVYQEMDGESDQIFGNMVKQMCISKGFLTKIEFWAILKRSSIQDWDSKRFW